MSVHIRKTKYQVGLENIAQAKELLGQPEFSQFCMIHAVGIYGNIIEIRLGRKQSPKPKRGLAKLFARKEIWAPTIAVFHLEESEKTDIKSLHLFGTEDENHLAVNFFNQLFENWLTQNETSLLVVSASILTPDETNFYYGDDPRILQEQEEHKCP